MSRTDKTKPWRVRVAEHHPWEVHHHESGVCDLPESPLTENGLFNRRSDGYLGCHWSDWVICYTDKCCHGCGCRLCSGYHWRREDRRRSRHVAQREARRILKDGDYDNWYAPYSASW